MYLVSHNLRSEPAMMILIGILMIAFAGIGRKQLKKKLGDQKNKNKLSPAMPPNPDPIPWKKDA